MVTLNDWKKDVGFRPRNFRDRSMLSVKELQPITSYYITPTPAVKTYSGFTRRTVDIVHPEWNRRGRNSPNIGGRFWTQTQYVGAPTTSVDLSTKVFNVHPAVQEGPLYPDSTSYNLAKTLNQASSYPLPLSYALDVAGLSAWGAKGIAQSLPTIPKVSIAQTLGELREGLPSVPLRSMLRKRKLSSVGDEYLNYQFGIAPLANDLDNYAKVLRNYDGIKAELHRQSEQDLRRRRLLLNESSTSEKSVSGAGVLPGPTASSYLISGGTLTTVTRTDRKIWFSGAFRYHIRPQAYEWLDQAADFNRIFGVVPTAKTLYELTPWSWFADWFSNGGDVFTNISELGRDGLYMRYGYVMASYKETVTKTWRGNTKNGMVTTSQTTSREVKQRLGAVPFGFGLTMNGLTPYQGSILTALGLSRLKL